jgi:small-conductance mechanosensitive channel
MLLQPIDYSRFPAMLAWPAGWAEIVLTGMSLGIAYAIDRRIAQRARKRDAERLGNVARVAFPLLALVLLYVSTWIVRHWFGSPFLLDIAIALMVALVVIRGLIFLLRRLFPHQKSLPPWERTIGAIVWFLLALYYLGVLSPLVEALDRLEIPIGKTHPTVLSILTGLGVVLAAVVLTLWVSGLLETRIDRITRLDTNVRAVIVRVVRATLLALAVMISLQAIGFDLTLLTVFSGAIGVGVGLGLQKLASNYISGFIILLDRAIRLGDTITVEGKYVGKVTRVAARYVLVHSPDGIEVIVPNETLVTTTVLNHSHFHAAPQIRVSLKVSVERDADVEKALQLLAQAATADARVMREAPYDPAAFVASFGEFGVNLELAVFVHDPLVNQLDLKSNIFRSILQLFGQNGILIAYPHREILRDRAQAAPGAGGAGHANPAAGDAPHGPPAASDAAPVGPGRTGAGANRLAGGDGSATG